MKVLFLFVAGFLSPCAQAGLCTSWSAPREIGSVDTRYLEEASGMSVSRIVPDTIYFHNDSGNGPAFFRSRMNGGGTTEITMIGGSADDTEDMSAGPCPGSPDAHCLFLADIGDNPGRRSSVTINIVQERESLPRQVKSDTVTLHYPGRSHDAEAFSVHPNGDFFIVTKDRDGDTTPAPHVYRFPAKDIRSGKATGIDLGTLDVQKILGDSSRQSLVTSMDMSADGKKFVLLTLSDAIEFHLDLASAKTLSGLEPGRDFSVIPLRKLPQQESISYLPGEKSFLYTSEQTGSEEVPILQLDCLN